MVHRVKLRDTLLLAPALAIFGCQVPIERSRIFLKPELSAIAEYIPTLRGPHPGEKTLLWRHDDEALALRSDQSAAEIAAHLKTNPLVMVTLLGDSELSQELARSDSTLFFKPPSPAAAGYALIPASDDPQTLLELARSLHSPAASAVGCGQLKAITSLLNTAASKITHIAPIYEEHIALPSVTALIKQIKSVNLAASVERLVAQGTRYHSSETGASTPALIATMADEAGAGALAGLALESSSLNYHQTKQDNLIISLPGLSDNATTVIIGAHMDSIVRTAQTTSDPAPGADDDASGIAVMLEALRILAANRASFERRIEFHAYAAEEVGLWGSQDLAARYQNEQRKIAGMLQLDMALYSDDPDSKTIYLVTNNTSSFLRRSAMNLMNAYLGGDYQVLALQAGTSDHQSWYDHGFPAVFPFEHPLKHNQQLHTANDTLANAGNFPLASRFTALVLAFLSHHAGLRAASSEYRTASATHSLKSDLKIAVRASTAFSEAWDLFVATHESVKKVELCWSQSLHSTLCQEKLAELPLVESRSGRSFFANALEAPLTLAAEEGLAVFAYAADDRVVARRAIVLRKS